MPRDVACRIPVAFVGVCLICVSVQLIQSGAWWAFVSGVAALFLLRSFLIALVRFIRHPHEEACLAVDENGVGFGVRTPDWWLFADGIVSLKAGADGYWRLRHVNGTCLCFPIAAISQEDIAYLQSKKMTPRPNARA